MATANREDLENFLMADHVDLSSLPAPKVIEELDFETIFQEMLADFESRKPDYTALLESDPVIIALEVAAYRELLLRNRINEAAKASMLSHATGTDLDNLEILFGGVKRMVIDEGDSEATPPMEPTYEDDERLRMRAYLSSDGFSTAGSDKAYIFHTFSASPKIKSVNVDVKNDVEVLITILSTEEDGKANEDLIKEIKDYVRADDRRPLTDKVNVESADIINYGVKAKIYIYPNPATAVVESELKNKLQQYLSKQHRIGGVVACSGIYNALHVEGVQKVELSMPTANIIATKQEAAYCTNIELEFIKAAGT